MRLFVAVTVLLAGCSLLAPARAEVRADQVTTAIERGVAYLEKVQRPSGRWADSDAEPGGVAALCTLALLRCGRKADSPAVKKALEHLERQNDPEKTYSSSLMIMAFAAADEQKYAENIRQLATKLAARQMKNDERDIGGWSYKGPGGGTPDNSNTHFAILALHEAAKAGVTIDDSTWKLAQNYLTQPQFLWNAPRYSKASWPMSRLQAVGGGFGYAPGQSPTGSMTCAAISSLLITREELGPPEVRFVNGELLTCGGLPPDAHVERAIEWLAERFSAEKNPAQPIGNWWLYYLWSLEHASHLAGNKYIIATKNASGKTLDRPAVHDWYHEGAELLLKKQDGLTGMWKGIGPVEGNPEIGTAFALLFLMHGRQPELISRLQHRAAPKDAVADSDRHRHALEYLTDALRERTPYSARWSNIDFTRRRLPSAAGTREVLPITAAHLADTPILFLSGTEPLDLSPEQRRVLKQYLDMGGFLLAESCSSGGAGIAAFDASFRALVDELFPGHQLGKLPPDHILWRACQRVETSELPGGDQFALYGLTPGLRTNIVYSPWPLSCYWELAGEKRAGETPAQAKREVEQALRVGCNVLAYATGGTFQPRSVLLPAMRQNPGGQPRPGSLVIPMLQTGRHEALADTALNVLLQIVEWRYATPVDYAPPRLTAGQVRAADYSVAVLQGRRAFQLSVDDRNELRAWLDGGGLLFAEAVCSNKSFAESLRRELRAIYPDSDFERIPEDHPIFANALPGFALPQVTMHRLLPTDADEPPKCASSREAPLLEGLSVDGRLVAILSPLDLSESLLHGPSLEHDGYEKVDAARLAANVLLYALQRRLGHLR